MCCVHTLSFQVRRLVADEEVRATKNSESQLVILIGLDQTLVLKALIMS